MIRMNLVAGLTTLVFALVPAHASADGGCAEAGSGVTVVVDARAAGGGVRVACAPGSPSSGFTALQSAGFNLTEVQGLPGFLCKIDGFPADQDCTSTPPADAFWSYWHASPGGSWTYSVVGGAAFTPEPGSIEGWAFGSSAAPGVAPPAPPPPATTSTTTTTITTSTTSTTTSTTTTSTTTTTTTIPAPISTTTLQPEPAPAAPVEASDDVVQSGDASDATTPTSASPVTTTTVAPVASANEGSEAAADGGMAPQTLVALGALVLLGGAAFSARNRSRKL